MTRAPQRPPQAARPVSVGPAEPLHVGVCPTAAQGQPPPEAVGPRLGFPKRACCYLPAGGPTAICRSQFILGLCCVCKDCSPMGSPRGGGAVCAGRPRGSQEWPASPAASPGALLSGFSVDFTWWSSEYQVAYRSRIKICLNVCKAYYSGSLGKERDFSVSLCN